MSNDYIDSKFLIVVLESMMYKDFNTIKKMVDNAYVLVNEDDINKEDYFKLNYLKTSISILKGKITLLLFIIENLSIKNIEPIKTYLNNLDITLNSNDDIKYSDLNRLVIPTKYNINLLLEILSKANELETYNSTNSPWKEEVMFYLEELYPDIRLQREDRDDVGYVPLTSKQKLERNLK